MYTAAPCITGRTGGGGVGGAFDMESLQSNRCERVESTPSKIAIVRLCVFPKFYSESVCTVVLSNCRKSTKDLSATRCTSALSSVQSFTELHRVEEATCIIRREPSARMRVFVSKSLYMTVRSLGHIIADLVLPDYRGIFAVPFRLRRELPMSTVDHKRTGRQSMSQSEVCVMAT